MSRSGNPYIRFFINDHEGELTLRGSSLAVRSLWLSMVFLMERGTPRGYLRLDPKIVPDAYPTPYPTPDPTQNKLGGPTSKKVGGPRSKEVGGPNLKSTGGPNLIPPSGSLESNLFAILGLPESDRASFKHALHELEQRGVFSRDERGVIYCRRIVKEEKYKEGQAKWGKMGAEKRKQNAGNPPRNHAGNPTQKRAGGPTVQNIGGPTSKKVGGPDSNTNTTYVNSPQPPSTRGGPDLDGIAARLKQRRKGQADAE